MPVCTIQIRRKTMSWSASTNEVNLNSTCIDLQKIHTMSYKCYNVYPGGPPTPLNIHDYYK